MQNVAYSIGHLKEPQCLRERPYRREVTNRKTHNHGGRVHFPKIRLQVERRGFCYFGTTMYFGLPGDFTIPESPNYIHLFYAQFKRTTRLPVFYFKKMATLFYYFACPQNVRRTCRQNKGKLIQYNKNGILINIIQQRLGTYTGYFPNIFS